MRIETKFNKYGWKLIVQKGKEAYQIYLRSNCGAHKMQKPFYLRLTKENMRQLKKLLRDIEK